MLVLSLADISIYAVQVLYVDLSDSARAALTFVSNIIWAPFIVDLVIRTVLVPSPWRYLLRHPIDVLAVVLPAFRALRALRILTAGQWQVTRGS